MKVYELDRLVPDQHFSFRRSIVNLHYFLLDVCLNYTLDLVDSAQNWDDQIVNLHDVDRKLVHI